MFGSLTWILTVVCDETLSPMEPGKHDILLPRLDACEAVESGWNSLSEHCETLIRNAAVIDGSGSEPYHTDVAITGDRISATGKLDGHAARHRVEAAGSVLAPGFIDVHTHDDTSVIRRPEMLPKLSQGVTTVIVGNCGISAAPVRLRGAPPDPMNLLGGADVFSYPTFASYVSAVKAARPSVNVAALVGHTALRNNQMHS